MGGEIGTGSAVYWRLGARQRCAADGCCCCCCWRRLLAAAAAAVAAARALGGGGAVVMAAAAAAAASRGGHYDALVKILLLGNSSVGKTCLLMRFCEDTFEPSFITTIGIDFKIRTVEIEGRRVKLQIWDTAGQERFRTITQAYYRQASSILLIYDVCERSSFEHIGSWMQSIKQHNTSNELYIVLVGNKVDKEADRVVKTEEGKAMADSFGIRFYECSASASAPPPTPHLGRPTMPLPNRAPVRPHDGPPRAD